MSEEGVEERALEKKNETQRDRQRLGKAQREKGG